MNARDMKKLTPVIVAGIVLGAASLLLWLGTRTPVPEGGAAPRELRTAPADEGGAFSTARHGTPRNAASIALAGRGGASERTARDRSDANAGATETPIDDGPGVAVKVTDASTGEPIADTDFTWVLGGPRRTRPLRVRTNEAGIFEIRGQPPGLYTARLRHPHFLMDQRALQLPLPGDTDTPLEILLEPGARLDGVVTDTDGKPVVRTRITIVYVDDGGPERNFVLSSPEGKFTFRGLQPGNWTLTAHHANYRAVGPLTVTVPASEPLHIELAADRPATVRVLAPDGNPVSGARVRARVHGTLPGAINMPQARTDAAGKATIRSVPVDLAAKVVLEARHGSYPALSRAVTASELLSGRVVLTFIAGRDLAGQVVDGDGAGVGNASVSVSGKTSRTLRTTASGEFLFRNLPSGAYAVAATTAAKGSSRTLVVDLEGASKSGLVLELRRGDRSVAGRVVGPNGQPLSLVPVRLAGQDRQLVVSSDENGEFRFEGILSGDYRVSAGDRTRGEVVLEKVTADTTDLVLKIQPPGSIRGTVSMKGPATGFSLRLSSESSGETASVQTYRFTSPSPRFHLEGVPAGTYRIELLRGDAVEKRLGGIVVESGEETGPVVVE